ncbi:unnamed protein product [Rhizoctonia solani]|uniref:Protein kinase domain-containing protein n=1 Tax=Rhizoctonia solani TaxID=456999 RepID=A0A8H3I2V1_9AGAM|nr:unnamed protein product [Rhizoctonia solani]
MPGSVPDHESLDKDYIQTTDDDQAEETPAVSPISEVRLVLLSRLSMLSPCLYSTRESNDSSLMTVGSYPDNLLPILVEDLFSLASVPSRRSTGQSAESLDSDSDTLSIPPHGESLGDHEEYLHDLAATIVPTFPSLPEQDRSPSQGFAVGLSTNHCEVVPPDNAQTIVETPDPEVTIKTGMPLSDVLLHLSKHGCTDVTQALDKPKCNEYPERIGGFGEVYRGVLTNGTKVSIKILKIMGPNGDEKLLKHAAHELYIWSKCKHPNVLELIGMAQFRNQITMVSPWMENGNLQSFLPQHPELDRCTMIHGDIKGANILVSHDYTPKLADFGNAWLSKEAQSLRFAPTTSIMSMSIRWAAPEIMLDNAELSYKADIYSLGMTILEVITGSPPYESLNERAAFGKIFTRTHPERPESHIPSGSKQADLLWSLLVHCWDPNPNDRPTAEEVRDAMGAITPEGLGTPSL